MPKFGNPSGRGASFKERGPSSSGKGPSADPKYQQAFARRQQQRDTLLKYQRLQARAEKSQKPEDVADVIAAAFYKDFGKKDIDAAFFDEVYDYDVPDREVLKALRARHPQFEKLHGDDMQMIEDHLDED